MRTARGSSGRFFPSGPEKRRKLKMKNLHVGNTGCSEGKEVLDTEQIKRWMFDK